MILNGLILSIVVSGIEFSLPLVKFGFVLPLLELFSVRFHPILFDLVLAIGDPIASLLGFGLRCLDLLWSPFDLTTDVGHLKKDLVESSYNCIIYWHSYQTHSGVLGALAAVSG